MDRVDGTTMPHRLPVRPVEPPPCYLRKWLGIISLVASNAKAPCRSRETLPNRSETSNPFPPTTDPRNPFEEKPSKSTLNDEYNEASEKGMMPSKQKRASMAAQMAAEGQIPKRRGLRMWRSEERGGAFTRGGRGRTCGRCCCCTIVIVILLIVGIVCGFLRTFFCLSFHVRRWILRIVQSGSDRPIFSSTALNRLRAGSRSPSLATALLSTSNYTLVSSIPIVRSPLLARTL